MEVVPDDADGHLMVLHEVQGAGVDAAAVDCIHQDRKGVGYLGQRHRRGDLPVGKAQNGKLAGGHAYTSLAIANRTERHICWQSKLIDALTGEVLDDRGKSSEMLMGRLSL